MSLFDDIPADSRRPRSGGLFGDIPSDQPLVEMEQGPVTTPLGQRLWRRPMDVAIQAQQPVTQGVEGAIRAANQASPFDDMMESFPGEATVRGRRFRLGTALSGVSQGVGQLVDRAGQLLPRAGEEFDALLPGGNPLTALGRQLTGGGEALERGITGDLIEQDQAGRINLSEFDPNAVRSEYMDAVADRIRRMNEQASASMTPEAQRFQQGLAEALPEGARATLDFVIDNPGHLFDIAASLAGSLAVGGVGSRVVGAAGGGERAQMLLGMIGGNALLAASNAGMDTYEQIRRVPIEEFADDELFQQYVQAGMSPEDARDMIAKMGADISMMGAAFGTAGAMYAGDRMGLNVLERTVLGRFPQTAAAQATTRLGQAGLATTRQSGQELLQGASTEFGTATGRLRGGAQDLDSAIVGAGGAAVLEAIASAPTTAITAGIQDPQAGQQAPTREEQLELAELESSARLQAELQAMEEADAQAELARLQAEQAEQAEQSEQRERAFQEAEQEQRIGAALGQIMMELAAQQDDAEAARMAEEARTVPDERAVPEPTPDAGGPATATLGEMSPELAALQRMMRGQQETMAGAGGEQVQVVTPTRPFSGKAPTGPATLGQQVAPVQEEAAPGRQQDIDRAQQALAQDGMQIQPEPARAPERPQEARRPEPAPTQRVDQDRAAADGPVRLVAQGEPSEGATRLHNAINRALQVNNVQNPPAGGITVVDSAASLPEQYRAQIGDRTEGFYDPETDAVYLISENINNPARGRWVAMHEMAGHVGLRRAAESQGVDLGRILDRMEQNPTVRSLTDALVKDRPRLADRPRSQVIEEALAELQAARRTGNYQALNDRYGRHGFSGVRDPNSMRALLDRLIERIKKALNFETGVTDSDVAQLLEDAWSQVRDPAQQQEAPAETAVAASEGVAESEAGRRAVEQMMKDGEAFAERNDLPPPARVLPDNHPLLEPKFDDSSPERIALRERLIAQRFEGAEPGERVAVVMGGGGASGKGTVLGIMAGQGILPARAVSLDPDAFKTGGKNHTSGKMMDGIPEYRQIAEQGDGRSALVTHEESSLMYRQALQQAIEGGYPVVLDRTLSGGAKAINELQALKDAGYKIQLVGVSIPAKEAMRRAVERAKGPEKRYVPLQALADAHAGFSRHFEDLVAIADEAALFDNNVPKGAQPIEVARKFEGETLEVIDQSLYNDFRRKANERIAESEAEAPPVAPTGVGEGRRRAAGEGTGRAGQAQRREGPDRPPAQRLTVTPLERGAILVEGDPTDIRSRLPEGIRGRVVEGGVRFTATDAARVQQILEGRTMTYSRAGRVLAQKPMRDGKFVGAPERFNTPSTIRTLRRRLRQYTDEGERGRFWYEDSSQAILDYVQGDVTEAKKLSALMSIYSSQMAVAGNSTVALRAYAQHRAGLPIKVKTKVQDDKANAAMADIDGFWSGQKTGNFFLNLLRQIDPSTGDRQGATIDLWMMRAAEYANDRPTDAQYAFMEDEVNRIAQERGWEPQQVQAAIWVGLQARMENADVKRKTEETSEKNGWLRYKVNAKGNRERVIVDKEKHRRNWIAKARAHKLTDDDITSAAFHYGDGIRRHIGQLSLEATPGRSTGFLPGIHDATYEQRAEFLRDMYDAITDENGVDMVAARLGLLVGTAPVLPGVWEGDINPSVQLQVAIAQAMGKPGAVADPAKSALNSYAAIIGYLFRQEGVGWHKPIFATAKRDANGIDYNVGRALTDDEAAAVERVVDDWMRSNGVRDWSNGMGLISTPEGIRVVSFGAVDNATLQGELKAAIDEAMPDAESLFFRTEGDLVSNNWRRDADGQGYAQRAGTEGSSDVFEWARDVLGPRVETVVRRYEKKWGRPQILESESPGDRTGEAARSGAGARQEPAPARRRVDSYASLDEATRGIVREGTPIFAAQEPRTHSERAVGVHYSRARELTELDPSKYGAGARGAEARRVMGTNLANRTYFYEQTDRDDVPTPERIVGTNADNIYRVVLDNIYDGSKDPLRLAKAVREEHGRMDASEFELLVLREGFDGYRVDGDLVGHPYNFVVVLDPQQNIPVESYDDHREVGFLESENPLPRDNPQDAEPAEVPWWASTGQASYDPEGAMMQGFFKDSMLGYKRMFESASDRLRTIPGMELVGEMIDQNFDREQRNVGIFNGHMAEPVRTLHRLGLNPATRSEYNRVRNDFERWAEAWDQRGDHQTVYEATTDLGRQLIDAWKAVADVTGNMNRMVGVEVYDPRLKRNRPIGKVKQFYPRKLKRWVQNAMGAPTRHEKDWAKLVEILLDEGVISKAEDAEQYIKKATVDADRTNDYFAGLEKARTDNWPAQLYDYSLDTALDYGPRWAERLAQIETFGQKDSAFGDAWDALMNRTRDPALRKYLRRIHKVIVNKIEEGDEWRWVATLNSLATGLQIGNPQTSLQNLITGSGLNYVAYGKYAAKGQLEALRRSAPLLKDAVEAGVIREDILRVQRDLHEAIQDPSLINQAVSWLTSRQMTLGTYNLTESIIRLQAYAAGRYMMRDLVKYAGVDPTTRRAKKLIAVLQRNGFDYRRVLAEGGEGPYTDRVLRYIVNLPQGSYRINMTPVLIDTQFGRFTLKYRKYGTQVTRLAYMNHLKPAWEAVTKGGEKVMVQDPVTGEMMEKRLVDFMQVFRMIMLPPVYGTANRYMRWAMFGTAWALAGPDLEDLKKAMDNEDFYRALLLTMSIGLESQISSGILAGGVSDVIQYSRDFRDRRYLRNPLEPPALSPLQNWADFIRRTINEGEITEESLRILVDRTMSLFRTYERAGLRLAYGLDTFDRPKIEMYRRNRSWVRKLTREFAASEDYDDVIQPSGGGSFATNPNTAVARKLRNAVIVGRPEQARQIMIDHLSSIEDGQDRANARNALVSHVRNQQPIVVGSTYAHDRRALFLRWAKENYTERKYRRIREIDEQYRRTAHEAINMPLRDASEDEVSLQRRAERRGRTSEEEIQADLRRWGLIE